MSEKKKLRRLPKRILSFVLTLAMMLTLMPMFSTTVYAEPEDLCNFTATPGSNGTITIDGESKTSETWLNTKDGNTFTVNGDTVTYNDYGGNTVTLKAVPNEGYVFDKWTSYSVTISNGDEVGDIVANFKIPEIPEHTHIWNYSVNGATLVAKCTGEGDCTVTNGKTDGVSLTLTASSANYSGNTPVIQLGTDTEKSAWEGAGLAALDAANLKYYKSTGEGSATRANDIELSVSTLGTGNYVAEYTLGDAVAKVAFAIAGNISLDDSTENGYVFIKDPDDTGEYHLLDTDENVSIGSDKIKIYTVPAYGYKLDKITVSYGDNSTDYEDGCVVDLPQDKDVTIFASFEPISISVELSDHTKGLLKKLIELTGDSEEQAVETVSYYLADSDWTAYNSIEKMLSEGCLIPEEEFPKYIKAQFYMAFLETSFSLNGFALEENAGLDQLKCIINEIPPVVYKALDLCDSIRERDYENTIVLASEVEEDGLYTYNKVLGYEWDSEDALDERDFLNAVKNYLTDNAVSGDLFTNPKDASEKYAEYIAKLCGLTDSVSISKFKQYADEWAIDEGNQYMLNYFGNLLSEEEFLDLTEEEKQNYVDKALTGMCLSMFDSFKWNHFAKDGEHFSADKSECTFVDIMRESLDILVAHKEAMINLINICDLYYGKKVYDDYEDSEADYYDEDNKMTPEGAYHYINGYFNEILDVFSAELYTDWDNLYKTIQGENVVSSAFEVTDSDSGRTIKLLKDISFARLGQNPETLVIGEDNSIILDLNGHKINRNLKVATENGSVIIVNGQLSVIDTGSEGTGKITGGNTTGFGGGIYVSETGDFSMTGGSICENTARDGGAGLYVAGTAMLGGTAKIKNNIKRSGMDESANNVLLADGKMLNIGTGEAAPATGMEIHVQGGIDKVIVNSGATENDTNYFHADDSSKIVLFDNGKLKIGIPKDTWTYSAEAAVLTASCNGECGTAGAHTVTLTLTATSPNYSGIDNLTEFNTATGKNIAESDVKFYKVETEGATTGGSLVEGTPTEAGYYYASITVAEVTAKKAFTIAYVDPDPTVSYTVEFISKGDVVKAYNNVKSGSLITEPASPDVAGFAGWYKDETCTTPWNFDVDTVEADTKIYAKYVLTVTVTLDVNGGTFAGGTETELEVNINEKLDEKTLEEIADNATNGAMVFSGWFKDEYSAEAWDFNEDIVTKDITLYIGWGYPAGHEEVAELSVTKVKDYIYTGKKITPAVSVSFGGKVLVPGTDYTVSYKNNVKAYNTVSGNNLVINEDGSIDYSNVDTAKAPTIIIKGKKNYSNKTIALNFNIQPVSLGNNADTLGDNISADICDNYATNNKSVIKVNGTVSYKGKKLNARDYTLTLVPENAEDASGNPLPKTELVGQKIPKGANGTFKLTAVGNGNYDGGFVKIITVADGAKTLQKAKITLKKIEYSGHDLTVDEIVDAAKGKLTVKIAGKPLTYGKDYTVEFPGLDKAGSRTNGGIYPIVIKGMGEYVGSRMVNVTVNGISIKKAVVTLDVVNPVYSGHHIGTNIKSVSLNGVGLTAGIDYDAVVKNDVKAGKASVTITGKGIYSGTKKVSYKIQKVKLTNEMFENVTISDNAIYLGKYDYRGGVAITPNVSIIYNGVKLINPADYSISLKNNTKAAGTAKATIKGKGNYTGSVNAIFSIGEDKIDNSKVNVKKATISVANKIYTGREITISGNDITKAKITVKEGKRNVTKDLILGTDFEIVSYVKNVNVGKAQFIIRGIGNYDGYKLVTFKITKKDLKWWQKELQ